jgi:hypothetical protein
MLRQFSIPTVLRMVPKVLLKELFERLGHGEFDPGWQSLKDRDIQPILAYLATLPASSRNEVEGVFRAVFDLACSSGFDALLEAGRLCGHHNFAWRVPPGLSVWGRAIWAWLNHREIFDKAQVIHQVDQLPWWRKRNDLPQLQPDTSPEASAELELEISALLQSQGRGQVCTVETMTLDGVDHFLAYPDDFVQTHLVHDDEGQLAPQAIRKTLQVVFAYNRAEGSLELFARLPKGMKERLEAIFSKTILHWDLGEYDPDAAYELDQLKDRRFDLSTDPEDRLRLSIRKMRLSSRNNGRRVVVEVSDEHPTDHIHKALEECLDLRAVPLCEWHATLVTFCFEFLPMEGRQPGRLTFDVVYPRSCNLRNARPERVELIQKYLKRWNIDRGAVAIPAPLAMGA